MELKTAKKDMNFLRSIGVTALIIAFFVGIVLAYYGMVYSERRSRIVKDGEISAIKTSMEFNEYLSTSLDAIEMTAYTVDGMIAEGKSDEEILDYLVGQSTAIMNTVFENTTGMYGYINGKFVSGSNWTPPDDFVATERPWYIKAISKGGEIAIVEPYKDAQTGNIMMAISKTLSDGKNVVAFDITLDEIQEITEDAVNSDISDVEFIIDRSGNVITHSDKNEFGKNYIHEKDSLGDAVVNKLFSTDEYYFEVDFKGVNYIVYSEPLLNDWFCISVKETTSAFRSLNVILVVTICVLIAVVTVITIIMRKSNMRNQIAQRLSAQLSSTAEIYVSMHEINFITDTFTEVRNNKNEASALIGVTRDHCQQMIRSIMEHFSAESTRDSILDFVDFSKLNARLSGRKTITSEFLNNDGQWRRARFIVSERTETGGVARAMYLIEDIDGEKRDRDTAYEAAKKMNDQIASVAKIYFTMYDIDVKNNTLSRIKNDTQNDSGVEDGDSGNAQHMLYEISEHMTHITNRSQIHNFMKLSDLDDRLKEKNTITEEFLSSNERWRRARFVVSGRDTDNTISHVLWLVEGIDDEKRMRDELLEASETLGIRMASIVNIYMTVHEIDIVNDTFTEIKSQLEFVRDMIGETSTNAQETLSKVMASIVDEQFRDEIIRFVDLSTLEYRLSNRDTISIEYMNRDKLWRRGRFVVSRCDDSGKLTHVMWLSEDIDDEKKESDKLLDISERALAASEARSSFLADMSERLRLPINNVIGMNEMIMLESDNENISEYSESVNASGNHLLGMINDIFDFSKIESGKMEIVPVDYDLASMINDIVSMTQAEADKKGLRFELEINSDLPRMLRGDEAHIKQIVTNLLENSLKYTEKGSISLTIRFEKLADEPDAVMMYFAVKDTGVGIRKENMKKIFDITSTSYNDRSEAVQGTGLGMYIIQRLLEMMDSSLKAESIYGLGSKFSFRLKQNVAVWEPLGNYEAAYKSFIESRMKGSDSFRAPDAEILVVDDTPINITVLKSLLRKTGIKTDSAVSGKECLSLTSDKKYDIIFIDHSMPDMDGIETLHKIRENDNDPNHKTPVICLTANASESMREQYLEEGFDDHLIKPIDHAKLEEMLLKYIPENKIIT